MKKKLFAFFILVFGLCGTLGYFSLQQKGETDAASITASVWDGKYYGINELTDDDWYQEVVDTKTVYHIGTAKGFSYLVYTVNGLEGKANRYMDAEFVLETDIDLANLPWIPIGYKSGTTYNNSFMGSFDGNGHYIYNLNISQDANGNYNMTNSYQNYLGSGIEAPVCGVGLFGVLYGRGAETAIKNLHLRNANITITSPTADMNVGALVGEMDGTTKQPLIENCSVGGKIDISNLSGQIVNVGGAVGSSNAGAIGFYSQYEANEETGGSDLVFYSSKGVRSFVDVSLNGTNTLSTNLSVGGVLGKQTLTRLAGSVHEGTINLNGLSANVGGLVGVMRAGAAGSMFANRLDLVKNSYNIGEIKNVGNDSAAGGLFGSIKTSGTAGTGYTNAYYFSVEYVYNAGTIVDCASNCLIGGLIGDMTTSSDYICNFSQAMQLNPLIYNNGYMSSLGHMFGRNYFSGYANEVYYDGSYTELDQYSVGTVHGLDELARSRGFYLKGRTGFVGTGTNFECEVSLWNKPWDFSYKYYGNHGSLYDGEGVWEISSGVNDGLPYIIIDGNVNNDIDTTTEEGLRGSGTASDPYLIETAGDLAWLSANWKNVEYDDNGVAAYRYYSLMNDIDLTGRTWIPIAFNTGEYFSGVFDGNGFKITGMTCSLYQQFEYHALFARTENAVIKNLVIDDVRYVNDGTATTSVKKANLIGYAGANTYVINCSDLSKNGVNTIGSTISGNLSVFYGSNNFTQYCWNESDKKITLDFEDGVTYLEGFDVEIDGNGGHFYDSKGNVYSNYHTLVLEYGGEYVRFSSVVYFDEYKAFRSIDATYAERLIPKTSEYEGRLPDVLGVGYDIIIRRGYQLLGFNFGKNLSTTPETDVLPTDGNFDSMYFESGDYIELKAYWQRTDGTITIDYNQYETTAYTASGDYSEINYVNYDAFLYDYYNLFKKYSSVYNGLRPGFKVVGIYSSYNKTTGFSGLVWSPSGMKAANQRLNTNYFDSGLNRTYYAKWEGSSTYKYELKLSVGKTEEEFYKDFDIKDAIESVELIKNTVEYERDVNGDIVYDASGDAKTYIAQTSAGKYTDIEGYVTAENGVENLTLSFEVSTDVAAVDGNYYTLKVNLKNGYVLTENISLGSETTNTDTSTVANYGVYATEDENRTKFGYLNYERIAPDYGALEDEKNGFSGILNKTSPSTEFKIENIVSDYNIFLELSREEFRKPLSVISGVYFGIAPDVSSYSEVAMAYGSSALYASADLSGYSLTQTDEDGNAVPTRIAYNFVDNYVLSSSGDFDFKQLTGGSQEENSRVAFRYKLSDGLYEYYFYELTFNIQGARGYYYVTLYKAAETAQTVSPENLTKEEQVVRLTGEYIGGGFGDVTMITYLTDSSFALIYSTESESVKFYTHSPTTSNEDGFTISHLNKTDGATPKYHKLMMSFENFVDFPTLSAVNENGVHEQASFSNKIKEKQRSAITVVGQYTEAVFDFEYYTRDAEGNLERLLQNAPTAISMIRCNVTDVAESPVGLLQFNVASSNYFKFAVNYDADEENGVVLYDLSKGTASNFNIKISVDASTITEEVVVATAVNGAVDSAAEYVAWFNDHNADYFTPTTEVFYKGQYKDRTVNDDTYTSDGCALSLQYNKASGAVDWSSLQAGRYTVQIICEEVLYTLETHTKFLDVDDKNEIEFEDEVDHEITTESSAVADIRYSQSISLSTELGQNKAYEFYGWYLQQNSAGLNGDYYRDRNGNIVKNSSLSDIYYNLNNQTEQNQIVNDDYATSDEMGNALNRFELDVYAVYLKKEISFDFSDGIEVRYAIADNQNLKDIDALSLYSEPMRRHLIDISMTRNVNGVDADIESFEYKYTTASTSENFGILNFAIMGVNAQAYDIFGVMLVDIVNKPITDIDGNPIVLWSDKTTEIQEDGDVVATYSQNFDLHEIIKTKMEAGLTQLEETYYILPILKKKEVNMVFHSGTGVAGLYSDGRDGVVYNSEAELVDTEKTFTIENKVLGDKVDTSTSLTGIYDTESTSLTLNDLFYSRVGYKNDAYGYYWARGEYVAGNLDKLSSTIQNKIQYFENQRDGDSIHFYRLWAPQVYVITFDPNGGQWSNGTTSPQKMNQTFDASAITAPTRVSMVGYNLAGWELDGEKIFDRDGLVVQDTSLYDEYGLYIYPANVTLKAIWMEKIYNITVNFNGANSVYHDGVLVKDIINDGTLSLSQQLAFEQNYLIEIDSTFAEMTYTAEDGNPIAIMLSQVVPERKGFKFAGYYVINGTRKTLITDETVFNYEIPTFTDNQEGALTLYVAWEFDSSALGLEIVNFELASREYSGFGQTIYLSEYFTEGNFTSTNFILDASNDELELNVDNALNTNLNILLSGNADSIDQTGMSFVVRDAGTYTVNMLLSVSDIVPKLNQSTIWSKTLSFRITIDKAELTAAETLNSTVLAEKQVENAKRIMQPFFEENSINSCTSISELVKKADAALTDDQIMSLTTDELYAFIMTKYYLLLTTNDGIEHNAYRAWTYYAVEDDEQTGEGEDEETGEEEPVIYYSYEEYLAENDNSEMIANLDYFEYYDYSYIENTKDINLIYNAQTYFELDGVKLGEIGIYTLKIFSSNGIEARNLYDLRLYIAETTASVRIGNYDVESDDFGAYVTVGKIFILPQVLDIQNLGSKTSYYQIGATEAEIAWQGGRTAVEFGYETLYNIMGDYYLGAKVLTSNAGSMDVDTIYNHYDDVNYLYFSDVNLLRMIAAEGTTYNVDVEKSFKLRMPDEYTILNTTGVAEISLTGKKFTMNDEFFAYEDLEQDIFAVSVTYSLEGELVEQSNIDMTVTGAYFATTAAGTKELIYEIKEYDDGKRAIFVNSHVTNVTFATSSLYLDTYTALYEWTKILGYSIDGTMETNNSLSFDFVFDIENRSFTATTSTGEEIVSSEEGVTEIEYYAVFTDLVRVAYDYSLPDTYGEQEAFLRLGVSTFDDLFIPSVNGFELSSLKEGSTGANVLDEAERTSVFLGENGTFVGLNEQNRHLAIKLTAKWKLPDIYEYTPIMTGIYATQVLSFDGLHYSNVVEFDEAKIFEYSYYWQYRNTSSDSWGKPNISSSLSDRYAGTTLLLNGNGSYSESGEYKLIVQIKLLTEYRSALDEGASDTYNIEASFGLQFKRIKIGSVAPNGETSVVYNALDRSLSLAVSYCYYNFDFETQDYAIEGEEASLPYTTTGNIVFNVSQDGNAVKAVKNVGTYDVEVTFNEDYYDTSELAVSGYQFEITPYVFELLEKVDAQEFDATKTFNSLDTPLEKKVYVNDEILAIELKREAGEDIGSYDITLSGIASDNKGNYILALDGTYIYENEALTASASSAVLGQFTITAAQKLIISYTTTAENPAAINADYSVDGYSLSVSGQTLQIMNGTEVYKTLTLKLFDKQNNKDVAGECLTYISPIIESLQFQFFNQTYFTTIFDSMLYTYAVGNSVEMEKYYTAVEFDKNFSFTINKISIDFSAKLISKTFDGNNLQNLDLDGNEIEDIEQYFGVYIVATYASVHVADDIAVTLSLYKTTGSTENLNNYLLENILIYGSIEKLAAQLTFNTSMQEFAYGDIDASNLERVLDRSNPFNLTANGKDIELLLENGYYSLSYSIASTEQTDTGFVSVGTHTLQVEYDFNDFEITMTNPTFEIFPLEVVKTLSAGFITILNTDTLQEYYEETMTVATGDEFTLNFYPQSVTLDAQNRPNGGYYSLTFASGATSATVFDGNIIVSLESYENAFAVVEVSTVLYVQIVDTSVLTQTYNGKIFTLSSNGSALTIESVGLATPAISALRFYELDGADESDVSGLTFTEFTIATADAIDKNVEKSKLTLSAIDSTATYANILLDDVYYFEIIPKQIDIGLLGSLDKDYDGTRSKTIDVSVSAGKVDGDDLSVSIIFETQIVKNNQKVDLYLQGEDKTNYSLSSTTATANLTKAHAIVALSKTSYTYGELRTTSSPEVTVTASNGKVVGKTLYTATFNLTSTATASAVGYLGVGTYEVSIATQDSNYYILEMDANNSFEIMPYTLDLVFDEAGGLKISADDEQAYLSNVSYAYTSALGEVVELSLTRSPNGNGFYHEIGDYFVISATTTNVNYDIESVTDNAGFVRITKSKDIVYMLLSDETIIAEDDMKGLELSIEYNGYSYDTVAVEILGENWILVVSSSIAPQVSRKEFALNAYQRVMQEGTDDDPIYDYHKLDGIVVQGLLATLQLKGVAKDVNQSYIINAYNAYSDNYDVRFGKNGATYTYDLDITPKQLYFTEGEIDGIKVSLEPTWQIPYMSKTFNNEYADFEIENATPILTGFDVDDDGLVGGETVGLHITFKDGDAIAKYASAGYYSLEVSLIGDDAANYVLSNTFVGNSNIMRARIEKAQMTIVANSKYYTYGELVKDATDSVTLEGGFTYETDVDLDDDYISNFIENKIFLQIISPSYSQSDALCAGEYNLRLSSSNNDFSFVYVVNGTESTTLDSLKVTVSRKPVEIVQKEGGQTLKEVFTKVYDGDANVESLEFAIDGILTGDEVEILSATYATANIGDNIQVLVETSGKDIDNYNLKPYLYGTIKPIIVSLVFNYDSETTSDVVSLYGLSEISELKYPFVSSGSLTTNSNDVNTSSINNFPTMLFKVGKTFSHWSMRFAIGNDSIKRTFLENSTSGMTTTFDEATGTFEVVVGNNAKTVSFLSSLIGDDITNMFGYYYKNNNNPEIVFEPNFTTQQILLNINIVEPNSGTVKVSYNGTEKEVTKQTSMAFDYGTKITLTATPNAHYYFTGFKIGQVANTNSTYTIEELTAGTEVTANFAVQLVKVVYDLTGLDASTITLPSGFVDNTLSGNYAELANVALKTILLTREGYDLTAIEASVGGVTKIIQKADFETTTVATLLEGNNTSPITLTLKPSFDAEKIKVVLNYNYDAKTEDIFVAYQGKFNGAIDAEGAAAWVEKPERVGYTFAGWWSEDGTTSWGEEITGESTLETTEEIAIYAKWTVNSYALKLSVENATITQIVGATVVENEGVWSAEAVDFEAVVVITLKPNAGYMVSTSGWAEYFAIEIADDGLATITLTMPAHDVDYKLLVEPESNTITVSGVHLSELSYTIETTTNNQFDDGTAFNIDFKMFTGESLEIEFVVMTGYYVQEISIADKDGKLVDFTVLNAEYVYDENGNIVGITLANISQNLAIEINATERLNRLMLTFDDYTKIESIESSDGYSWDVRASLETEIYTGSELIFYIKYKLGYTFDSCSSTNNVAQKIEATAGTYEDWIHIKISGMIEDSEAQVNSKLATFTVLGQAVSYEMDGSEVVVSENIVYVNGTSQTSAKVGEEIILTFAIHPDYEFAGWSTDGVTAFSSELTYAYMLSDRDLQRIENDQIILYGIFSKLEYEITFGTYSYYVVGTEYADSSKHREIYEEIVGTYFDESGNEIFATEIFYGTNKEITFKIPTGYSYVGFGYNTQDGFKMLGQDQASGLNEAKITIFSTDENISDGMKIYFVVAPLSANIKVKNIINYDGIYEDDTEVGSTFLYGANESYQINEYGYVEGTKVHFADGNFENGKPVSDKNFDIVAYSGDEIYLLIQTIKEGYKFDTVSVSNSNAIMVKEDETETYVIYRLVNFVGGLGDIEISVLFKPQINLIKLKFVHNNLITDGGAFEVKISSKNSYKVFTSGREYSSLVVSAYTDTEFDVVVFIRAGFYVNSSLEGVIEDLGNIIVEDSAKYSALSVDETGYTGMISFKVKDYLGLYDISIILNNLTYTVNLKENATTLATIKNVEFDKLLNLSETNIENITIYDERLMFVNGHLYTILTLDKHNFEGYFTGQNGAGVQYIDSHGDAINYWNESGYMLNNLTSEYVLTENAHFDEETGEMIIDLYVYLSYLKTRISFEIVPNMNIKITAQDLISGVDYTNSWYYAASPMYMEVSYDTDIYFNAPEISGFTFYKFIISQRNANGEWLTDVESTLNNVPWSTNEFAQIVECNVKVVYFAQIEISYVGGDAKIVITQEGTPQSMLEAGYVDTTKSFSITAVAAEGYEFVYWKNMNSGNIVPTETYSFARITSKLTLQLHLQGQTTVLNFVDYSTTFGYIRALKITSRNGTAKLITLGTILGEQFMKLITETSRTDEARMVRVGDVVTFEVWIDYGFSAVWNREDITLQGYQSGYYNFVMTIASESAGQTLKIIPTFTDQLLSFYVERRFVEVRADASDTNFVDMAGHVTYNGQKTVQFAAEKGQLVEANIVTNPRYAVSKVKLINYNSTFEEMSDYLTEDNRIVLTREFLETNSIVGNVQIVIEFDRLLWEEKSIAGKLEGEGTSRNKYQINSVEDLVLMMQLVNSGAVDENGVAYKDAHYILQTDIDLTENFWTPIGTKQNAFNGEFDFGKFKITGIFNAYFYSPIYYNGLFGHLGPDANIHETNNDLWYILLTVGIFVIVLVLLIILIVRNKRKKKRRQELAHK